MYITYTACNVSDSANVQILGAVVYFRLGCPLEADENANYADRGFSCIMPNYAHSQSVELCRIMLGELQYAKIVLL